MSLAERLTEDMKTAMKSGEKDKLSTIRQLRAQIKDAQIAAGEELNDEAILAVMNNAAKKRRDAMDLYKTGGRDDLYAVEEKELAIIQAYLPKQLDEAELKQIVSDAAATVHASSPADFGKLMKEVMTQVKGKADGKMVQQLVRAQLN